MLTLNYVAMIARDLERALAFYRDLGLPIPEGAHLNEQGEPEAHVEVRVNGLRVAWESETLARLVNPHWVAPTGNARLSVAFDAGTPLGVDEVCAHMRARGHTVQAPPYDAFWGQRYATLQDPDGNAVDIFAALPTT
ncbi:VOC family protein [Deinococcus maricopensis]|uniref:Glyoxalase/bleomycin resistance protein/dioxygenase n=1 Tax=Deinococcus maricopensis (strain DSM 21211 / LMG 22137 / NRRL B-23946 / LB-34) TaxID=709986 RepID=E8U9V7_DEIML|nr:VOC family protein [Deinococcus maricopensis]ADV67846.1 Glyoxalase/bleomycin resistance protein/dioxygenase [Deinococcus maricopensis DSM 21211]